MCRVLMTFASWFADLYNFDWRQIVARYRTYMDLIEQQKDDKKNPALKH